MRKESYIVQVRWEDSLEWKNISGGSTWEWAFKEALEFTEFERIALQKFLYEVRKKEFRIVDTNGHTLWYSEL